MKLSRISGDFICSLSYALLNKSRGKSGYLFQMYSLVWIMWLAFFAVGMLHPMSSGIGLHTLAYSLMPLSISSLLSGVIPLSVPVFVLALFVFVVLPYTPIHFFWIYENIWGISKRRLLGMQVRDAVVVGYNYPASAETGFPYAVTLHVNNPTDTDIGNVWLRWVFPDSFKCAGSQLSLGTVAGGSSGSASIPFISLHTGKNSMGTADLYFEIRGQKYTKNNLPIGLCNVICSCLFVNTSIPDALHFGEEAPLGIYLMNRLSFSLDDVQVSCSFSEGIDADVTSFNIGNMQAGSGQALAINIIPKVIGEISVGHFSVEFRMNGNVCNAGPLGFNIRRIFAPELNVRMNTPETLYKSIPASLGFIVENRSDESLTNISLSSCFSSQIECEVPTVYIEGLLPSSSRYVSIAIRPMTSGKADLGNLNVSFEVNGFLCRKEPLVLGVHKIN
ncbi:hypothetical protein [Methanolobus sp.]|uniref:hypothetical protein n=1 Tax=Methanolobus sp. TaxID=1874737 RepID=UPI0025DF335A|nr:hypothetical protein [Methanolobus sp.]